MPRPLRRSGIPPLGDVPQGTHICHFFETAADLFETARLFFAAGLESSERCVWLFIDPFGEEVTIEAFRDRFPQFERHLATGALMIVPAEEWLTEAGAFNVPFFTRRWDALIAETTAAGYDGLRVAGACFPGLQWEEIREHEQSLDDTLGSKPMLVLCSFMLETTGAAAIIDVTQTHHFAVVQREGRYDVVETPTLRLRQLETRNQQRAAVIELGLHAIHGCDLDALMSEAVTIAARTLDAERGLVLEARPEHGDLVLRARFAWDELPPDVTITAGDDSLAKFILTSDQPVIVADVTNDPRFRTTSILHRYGVAAVIAAVIRGRDRPWGLLGIQATAPATFSDDDLRFVETIATVLALAIERDEHERAERREKETLARLQAESEAALAKLHAIQSITDGALGFMALDDLLRELLLRVRDALQIDAAGVILLDERNVLTCRAVTGVALPIATGIPETLPPWRRLVEDPRPAIIDDYRAESTPEAWQWVEAHIGPVESAMSVPLIVEEKLIGAVIVDSIRPRRFTEDELELLRVVADRVAPVIERSRLLESVRAGRERLETLSRRLLSVQEEERRRLAIELHDELGQILTAVKINLELVPAQVRHAVDSVELAMRTTRNLALDLRPAMLDDLGLAAALRWYADRFAQQTRVAMHLAIDEVPDLEPALTTATFRVAQEALTNVSRHAAAQNVWLELHGNGTALELTVRDDGAGFDVDAAHERAMRGASLGLLGMEERVSLAGGSIDIRSASGKGTEIRAAFPVRRPA